MEAELVPCCRKFGLRVVVYNPLAYVQCFFLLYKLLINELTGCYARGGLFSGKISSIDDSVESGSRFDPNAGAGKMYRQRYFKDGYFQALALIREVAVCTNTSQLLECR